jgi:GNAT superfamily N-acetyltransferase
MRLFTADQITLQDEKKGIIRTAARRLLTKPRRLFEGIREGGLDYILVNINSRLPDWLFSYSHSYFLSGERVTIDVCRHAGCTYRPGTSADADRMERLDMSRAEYLDRLGRGHTFIVCEAGGELISYSCATHGRAFCRQSMVAIDTESDGFLLCGVYTVPERRRQGHFKTCLYHQIAYQRRQGRYRMLTEIDRLNTVSILCHQRLGFVIAGNVVRLGLLGLHLVWYRQWPWPGGRLDIRTSKFPPQVQPV